MTIDDQKRIDVSNLRFYANLFEQHGWQDAHIANNVFTTNLREIAERIESSLPFLTSKNTHPEDGGPKEIAFDAPPRVLAGGKSA